MDLLNNLLTGFGEAVTPANLLYCLLGCLLGTLIGVLPGIGPAAALAMLLPLTLTLDPTGALIMMAGIYYGSQYGGSTTAILINVPGENSSVITAIDGYQMARQGRGGVALATAALGSFFAGSVATLLIAAFAMPLSRLALSFTAPDYFALMVLGLVTAVVLASGSLVKALGMVVVGALIGIVGIDPNSGTPRFTFGAFELLEGVDFVVVAVGLFGLGEIMRNLTSPQDQNTDARQINRLIPNRAEMRRAAPAVLRGTALGSFLGILPGGGAIIASVAAYSLEKKVSKTPDQFGKGAIEGVAAPEAANNAGAQVSFIPMLTLGLPTNVIMAMMIAVLVVHGIQPGPTVIHRQPELFWGLIASMWVGNVILVILNLPLVGIWVRLVTIPYRLLFPAIIAFAMIGVYGALLAPFHIWLVGLFGLMGFVLARLDCEPAPLLLGLVLGPFLEEYLRRALAISNGDPMVFLTRPISATLLGLSVLLIIAVSNAGLRARRDEAFRE